MQSPYGSWISPIDSCIVSNAAIRLEQVVLDGEDTYWIESRPSEDGRNVIVRMAADGKIEDVLSKGFSARTRVHEYGGAAYFVHGGSIYFSNFLDQRLYRQDPDKPPKAISPDIADSKLRFADGTMDKDGKIIICVYEDHTKSDQNAVNGLACLNPESEKLDWIKLISGVDRNNGEIPKDDSPKRDFYSSPRLSPDGTRLAWIAWNHPEMPWDNTELWMAEFDDNGLLKNIKKVAGEKNESIIQPVWSPEGELYYVSDRNNWWSIYRDGDREPLTLEKAEFGRPAWTFGDSNYAFESEDRIICAYNKAGEWKLAAIKITADAVTKRNSYELNDIDSPYTDIACLKASGGRAVFVGGSHDRAASIVRLDLKNLKKMDEIRSSLAISVDEGYISKPEHIEFPTARFTDTGEVNAHAFYYPPRNRDFEPLKDEQSPLERPPLIVVSHGGPTAAATSTLNLSIQYWTGRGFAVIDVNYRGSSGFGRDYRQLLYGNWGIADVEDCVNGALYLVTIGKADFYRLAIRGGSAGGWTTLCALTFGKTFAAGASYYGVSDAEKLGEDTHKFESHYLCKLIGPYDTTEQKNLWKERSPINNLEKLSRPVIFFQGEDDRVVPPDQSKRMFEAIAGKKPPIPTAYLLFKNEQHGFRIAINIRRALEAELYFYSKIFGFELPEPVSIANLPKTK